MQNNLVLGKGLLIILTLMLFLVLVPVHIESSSSKDLIVINNTSATIRIYINDWDGKSREVPPALDKEQPLENFLPIGRVEVIYSTPCVKPHPKYRTQTFRVNEGGTKPQKVKLTSETFGSSMLMDGLWCGGEYVCKGDECQVRCKKKAKVIFTGRTSIYGLQRKMTSHVTLSNECGDKSEGRVSVSGNTITITALDWTIRKGNKDKSVEGTVTNNGQLIDWHNETKWVRVGGQNAEKPDIVGCYECTGNKCVGHCKGPAKIAWEDGELKLINECNSPSIGLRTDKTITAVDWKDKDENVVKGTLSDDNKLIDWHNETWWKRVSCPDEKQS
jgi:hypothetical protein